MNAYEALKWWKEALPWNELNVIKMKIRKRSDNVACVSNIQGDIIKHFQWANETKNKFCRLRMFLESFRSRISRVW